ncbi:unnamed protein product [Urochloa decumbens]|uniref:FBD domain-containing protein n=1 Tax=Urochloa decumbens TaxID=240449 RepID=A0ABC9E787_9POAL
MATAPGAKRERRKRIDEDEEDELVDRISRLPDGILGDIVSLLPYKDGARTQVLSSRWRPIWHSAPLNLDLTDGDDKFRITTDYVSRILSAHQGPGRRFCIQYCYQTYHGTGGLPAALDGWLRSPALDKLQELEFNLSYGSQQSLPPPLPASVHRLASTLRAASFGGCGFPEGNNTSPLHLPLLKQLSLLKVRISETSFTSLLAACPALQTLLLTNIMGCSRVNIVSPSLRSIGLCSCYGGDTFLQQLIIVIDAPYLERLLCYETDTGMKVTVSVVSAPNLHVLSLLCVRNLKHDAGRTTFQFGSTVFQRLCILNLVTVVHSVKVLALTQMNLSLDMVINFLKCFPCLENLYIKTRNAGEKNTWCHKYKNLISTLEIRLKKIVLRYYRGTTPHVNFAKFFILNARMLQSRRLSYLVHIPAKSCSWMERYRSWSHQFLHRARANQLREATQQGHQAEVEAGGPGLNMIWYEFLRSINNGDGK